MKKLAMLIGFNAIPLEHIPVGCWLEYDGQWWFLVWTE
jgi:hypothetical protein